MGDNADPRRRCLRCQHIDRPKYPLRRHALALLAIPAAGAAYALADALGQGPGAALLAFLVAIALFIGLAVREGVVCRKCMSRQLARLSPQDSIAASAPQAPPQ